MSNAVSSVESRSLELLGSGASPEQVAAALGVDASRISQLVSDPTFAAQVAELRFQSLHKHNVRDNKYDALEDHLLDKLDTLKDMMFKPQEILKALQVLNAAKRRGASAPEMINTQHTVVVLNMPVKLVNKFSVNVNNQVIQAGSQELVTMQSSTLLDQLKQRGITNDPTKRITSTSAGTERLAEPIAATATRC